MEYTLLYTSLFFCAVLIFYYLFYFSRIAFYKKKLTTKTELPPLSIVLCAHNERNNLEKNVPLLLSQQYPAPHQLLLVNDNSDDGTKLSMQRMVKNHAEMDMITIERRNKGSIGKKYPLSIGIEESKYNHLLLTDADCMPASSQWAHKMASAFAPGIDIVLGYGTYRKHPGWMNKVIRFETLHSAIQCFSFALAGQPYMGVGRNLSYTKDVFMRHKGFVSISNIPGGDDDLFINKAATASNTVIEIDKDAHTISVPKKKWSEWVHQKTRHYSTSKYYKTQHKFLLGLYSLSHFLFYPLLLATAIAYSWQIALALFLAKSVVQFSVFSSAMKKLNETDLIKWFFILDGLMTLYYLFFFTKLWKKESNKW